MPWRGRNCRSARICLGWRESYRGDADMRLFRDVPIQKKLRRITMLTTSVALLLTGVALIVYCSVHELARQCPLWRKGTAGLDLLQRLAAARELGPNRFDGGGPHDGSGGV